MTLSLSSVNILNRNIKEGQSPSEQEGGLVIQGALGSLLVMRRGKRVNKIPEEKTEPRGLDGTLHKLVCISQAWGSLGSS